MLACFGSLLTAMEGSVLFGIRKQIDGAHRALGLPCYREPILELICFLFVFPW